MSGYILGRGRIVSYYLLGVGDTYIFRHIVGVGGDQNSVFTAFWGDPRPPITRTFTVSILSD